MSTYSTLHRVSRREWRRVASILRTESIGGALLVAATLAALLLANLAPESYATLKNTTLGFDAGPVHLNLSLAHWAADGLLAVFFFLAGLELKREFVLGDLREPSHALVPVVAAACGAAVPALVFVAFNLGDAVSLRGWAIPAATDIAFALAVLALINSHLPSALRTFLLTLAVVDDLIAIAIIAVGYTASLNGWFLAGALVAVAAYGLVVRRWRRLFERSALATWLIAFPLGLVAWALLYNSGVHATVAGVLLAFTVPVEADNPDHNLAAELEHRYRPLSAGFSVPLFAFFSAGVALGGTDGIATALTSGLALGIVTALVLGKVVGIAGGTWLVTRLRHATLHPDLGWIDVVGLGVLGGIGFTVSLLIADLALPADRADEAKLAVLAASLLAAMLAAVVLGLRNRHYRALEDAATGD